MNAERLFAKVSHHFPNFDDIELRRDGDTLVAISGNSRRNISTDNDWVSILGRLKKPHRKITMEKNLQENYKHLNIGVYHDKLGMKVSLWVKGNGTALAKDLYMSNPKFHGKMQSYNMKARRARDDDYFWCSGCEEIHEKERYSYYYFAGKYCEQFKSDNPEHYRRAMNESYN